MLVLVARDLDNQNKELDAHDQEQVKHSFY
jgi:hypothetical protein